MCFHIALKWELQTKYFSRKKKYLSFLTKFVFRFHKDKTKFNFVSFSQNQIKLSPKNTKANISVATLLEPSPPPLPPSFVPFAPVISALFHGVKIPFPPKFFPKFYAEKSYIKMPWHPGVMILHCCQWASSFSNPDLAVSYVHGRQYCIARHRLFKGSV